jgi:hypothetical protein
VSAIGIGEIVDITIKGVRVTDVLPHGSVVITCEADRVHGVFPMPPQAAITHSPTRPNEATEPDDRITSALSLLDSMESEGYIQPYVAAAVRTKLGLPPRHWPPQAGDVWDDGFPFGGSLWFAREHQARPGDPDQALKIEMASVTGDRESLTPQALLKHAVEIRLAYRPKDGTQ